MKLQNLKLKCKNYNLIVGDTGFEPVTPALSRQCSEPTELITHMLKILKKAHEDNTKIYFK